MPLAQCHPTRLVACLTFLPTLNPPYGLGGSGLQSYQPWRIFWRVFTIVNTRIFDQRLY